MNSNLTTLQKFTNTIFLLTLLLMPLKFGSMLLPGVPQGYPDSLIAWVMTNWPPALFPPVAGTLLLLAVISWQWPQKLNRPDNLILMILWLLMPLIALLGFIDPDSLESAIVELEYMLGVAAYAAASAILLAGNDQNFRPKVFNTLATGTLLTASFGVYQYFWGFDELKKFIEMQEQIYQIKISEDLKARAFDVRTYATFSFASAMAGFLLLTGALTICRTRRWGELFEPVNVSRKLFVLLSLILCGGVFLTTKGRSAFLAVIIAGAFAGWLCVKNRLYKIILLAGAILAIAAGAVYIQNAGRGFSSMAERVGYLQSSWQMVLSHPWCGDGWGDFTYHHALNKSFGNHELAKDPHNFIAAFAAQTGLLGGLVTSALLFFAIIMAIRRFNRSASMENLALSGGLMAFSLHMLMDLDWQVPALMAVYSLLTFTAVAPTVNQQLQQTSVRSWLPQSIMVILALLALTGGIHWSMADQSYSDFLKVAGLEVGVPGIPGSRFTVDRAAGKALKIAPYSHSILNSWGTDRLRRYDLKGAEDYYLQALSKAPRSHAIHKSLSEVYALQGNKVKAQEYQQKADELFPYKKIFLDKMKGMANE